jgi:uncharacterized membrane protein
MAVVLLAMPAASAGTAGEVGSEEAGGPSDSGSAGPGTEGRKEYSFELLVPPVEMYKVMYVHHLETKRANLTVWNNGSFPATAYLGLAVNDRYELDWKVGLSNRSFHLLPNQTCTVMLIITGPSSGGANDYSEINISLTIGKDPSTLKWTRIRSYLVVDTRIVLSCRDNVHTTMAGVPTRYTISFYDNSDLDKVYDLSCLGPPDWDCDISPKSIRGAPWGEAANSTLTVTPPFNAGCDEVGIVSVTIRSARNPGVKDSVTTHTVVSGMMFIELGCPDPEKVAHPGDTVAFDLYVTNYGNMAGEVNVSLGVDSLSMPCAAWLEPGLVGLAGGETRWVAFKLAVPDDAHPGSLIVARLMAKDSEGLYSDDTTISVLVDPFPDLRMRADGPRLSVAPGETAFHLIELESLSGAYHHAATFNVRTEPVNWSFQVWTSRSTCVEGDNVTVYLEPGERAQVLLQLSVPESASAGEYRTLIRSDDAGGDGYMLELATTVLQMHSVGLHANVSKLPAPAGGVVRFPFMVTNTGNGQDNIDFDIGDGAQGWKARIVDAGNRSVYEVTLSAGETRNLTLEATVPARPEGLEHQFGLVATTAGGASITARFTADVLLPDLYMGNLSYRPKTIHAGDPVTINLTVYNKGPGVAAGVYVKFRDTDSFAGLAYIDRLPANASQNISFSWVAKPASSLEFTVDPDDIIAETDEHNNRVRERPGGRVRDPDPDLLGLLGLVAPALLAGLPGAGLAIIALPRLRKKR